MTTPDEAQHPAPSGTDPDVATKIADLLLARRTAREVKDFETADRIRAILDGAGVIVIDGPDASEWRPGPGFDPTKLEAPK